VSKQVARPETPTWTAQSRLETQQARKGNARNVGSAGKAPQPNSATGRRLQETHFKNTAVNAKGAAPATANASHIHDEPTAAASLNTGRKQKAFRSAARTRLHTPSNAAGSPYRTNCCALHAPARRVPTRTRVAPKTWRQIWVQFLAPILGPQS
jgi:hypothetical protein